MLAFARSYGYDHGMFHQIPRRWKKCIITHKIYTDFFVRRFVFGQIEYRSAGCVLYTYVLDLLRRY